MVYTEYMLLYFVHVVQVVFVLCSDPVNQRAWIFVATATDCL